MFISQKKHFAVPLKENKTFFLKEMSDFIALEAFLVLKKETSPLLKSGYLPHVALDLLWGAPPTYPSEETSFMDGP